MAFGKKNEVQLQSIPSTPAPRAEVSKTHIGKTMKVSGELFADEEVLIEGTVEGSIKGNGRILVGRNGKVKADIVAREIIIRGLVNGNVEGHQKVEIEPEGELNGDIVSQRVVLAEGARFKGSIDMSLKETPAKPKESEPPKTISSK